MYMYVHCVRLCLYTYGKQFCVKWMLFNDVNKYCMCVYPVKGVCNQGVALVIFYGLKI